MQQYFILSLIPNVCNFGPILIGLTNARRFRNLRTISKFVTYIYYELLVNKEFSLFKSASDYSIADDLCRKLDMV